MHFFCFSSGRCLYDVGIQILSGVQPSQSESTTMTVRCPVAMWNSRVKVSTGWLFELEVRREHTYLEVKSCFCFFQKYTEKDFSAINSTILKNVFVVNFNKHDSLFSFNALALSFNWQLRPWATQMFDEIISHIPSFPPPPPHILLALIMSLC